MRPSLAATLVPALALLTTGCLSFQRKAQPNTPPIAAVGISPSERVGPRAEVTLDGSASVDPDGRALTYEWTQLSGDIVWAGPQRSQQATFIAPERPQTLLMSLRVFDGKLTSEPTLVRIEVETNVAPVAAIKPLEQAIAGAVLVLDGRPSIDQEGVALSYLWRCTSHPSVAFEPNAQSPTPSVLVPTDVQATLSFELVVSDGRLTSEPSQASVTISAGNTTHWFVSATASCTGCDGSREKPFKTIGEAVDASPKKPILVASGAYRSLALTSSTHITGGCPSNFLGGCGDASERTVLSGADNERATVTVSGEETDVTLEHLTIIGPYGLTTVEFASHGIHIDNASFTGRNLDIQTHGVGPNVDATFGVWAKLAPRVHLFDSHVLGGRSRENTVIDLQAVDDFWMDRSTAKSNPDPRNGFLAVNLTDNHRSMTVLHTHGGGNYLLTQSSLVGDANSEVQSLTELRASSGSQAPDITLLHSVIWHKGNASGDVFVGPDAGAGNRRHKANRMVDIATSGTFTFVNDTFLGNSASADPASAECVERGASGCGCPAGFDPTTECLCPTPALAADPRRYACRGLSGIFMQLAGRVEIVNSYFQDVHQLLYSQSAARTVTLRHNRFFGIARFDGGDDLLPSLDVNKLGDGYQDPGNSMFGAASQAGEDNAVVNCALQDAAAGNAHLATSSPCIDIAAFDPRTKTTDRDGQPYPSGDGPDIGAYEVQQ